MSVTPGKHLSTSAISAWTKDVVGDSIEGFTLKRVRSGVTTLLAKLGVPREIRDQLQSHGLTSVDNRHYNIYAYSAEKTKALQDMYEYLTGGSDAADSKSGERAGRKKTKLKDRRPRRKTPKRNKTIADFRKSRR